MSRNPRASAAAEAVHRLAFDRYMRTGEALGPAALASLAADYEKKFNPNHDPANGRFTFGPGGSGGHTPKAPRLPGTEDPTKKSHYYQGRTAKGLGKIEPIAGGYTDKNGRYVPEVFAQDPYEIGNPGAAFSHYLEGSGTARNFYAGNIDASSLKAEDFEDIQAMLSVGKPGVFPIRDANGSLDTTRNLLPGNLLAGSEVGGVVPVANGTLKMNNDGTYHFGGWIGFHDDPQDFDKHPGRSPVGAVSTILGRQSQGRNYSIYIVGTVNMERQGRYNRKR